MSFLEELTKLLNRHSMESRGGNTPDYILAKYLLACLDAFDAAVRHREEWYEKDNNINQQHVQRTCAKCGADDWHDAIYPDTVEICNRCGASR
jgi:ribosomal protein S27AE